MRKYRAFFILDEQKIENMESFTTSVEEVIKEVGGVVEKTENLGRRQITAIDHNTATYLEVIVDIDPSKVTELKEKYRLNQAVIRLVVVIHDKPEITVLPKPDLV
ncbi:MAG: 30S ribosomal protein S6 [Lentisphaeria bacterium]|nr:30S ribosomal protein S6 [Lentisphaeria bacterium]NQZ67045.1 30S ribosomal protein S6 [Lentisphaeria bacterium]